MTSFFEPDFSKLEFNERFAKAAKIIERYETPVEIEFGDEISDSSDSSGTSGSSIPSAGYNGYKSTPIYRIAENDARSASQNGDILEYSFESGVILTCRVESYGKGAALFADFLRDAKKYYKKTCINAPFIYFFSYRPMYRELNHEQLCWYLFWRSRVRNGDYIKTGLSYIFLYIFEQINLTNLIGAEKVYANIVAVWKNYRKEFPRIDKYIAEWLTDFTIINQIKINLGDISEILPEIINAVTLPEIFMKEDFFTDPGNIDLILNNMTVHDYKKSKFYTEKDGKNKDLFDYHTAKIIHAVLSSEAFGKILAAEIEDGVKVKTTRESFMGAVCVHEYRRKITVEYKNVWKSFRIREIITNAVRHAENIIRDYLQIKSKLNISGKNFPCELADIIRDYRDKYLAVIKPAKVSVKIKDKKKHEEYEEIPEIIEFAPDLQAAAEIEKDSWATTNALLELQDKSGAVSALTSFADGEDGGGGFEAIDTSAIYEAVEDAAHGITQVMQPEESKVLASEDISEDIFDVLENLEQSESERAEGLSDMAKLIANLSADELSAVEMLINADFDEISADFMRERGVMLEAVIESVNERAMDLTGDIIFENGRIIEDYLAEMKLCIG